MSPTSVSGELRDRGSRELDSGVRRHDVKAARFALTAAGDCAAWIRAAAKALVLLLSLLPFCPAAAAHELHHSLSRSEAAVIQLFHEDGAPFAFETYEIYREGEEAPAQVGRTDRGGRIAFLPERAGRWRVKAFSEDGHGLDFTVDTGEGDPFSEEGRPLYERYQRIVVGLAVILGLFGLLMLVFRKRSE
jgi:nickel transport protein